MGARAAEHPGIVGWTVAVGGQSSTGRVCVGAGKPLQAQVPQLWAGGGGTVCGLTFKCMSVFKTGLFRYEINGIIP